MAVSGRRLDLSIFERTPLDIYNLIFQHLDVRDIVKLMQLSSTLRNRLKSIRRQLFIDYVDTHEDKYATKEAIYLHVALEHNIYDLIIEFQDSIFTLKSNEISNIMSVAIDSNNLGMLKYFHTRVKGQQYIFDRAAIKGKLEIVKYLHSQRYRGRFQYIRLQHHLGKCTCKYDMNDVCRTRIIADKSSAVDGALANFQFKVVDWLISKGYVLGKNINRCIFTLVEWLDSGQDRLAIIKWLVNHKYQFTNEDIGRFIDYSQFTSVTYLIERGYELDAETVDQIIKDCDIEIIKRVYQLGLRGTNKHALSSALRSINDREN